jgi:hypothetical protein
MMNEVNKPHQPTAQTDAKKDVEVTATKVETAETNIASTGTQTESPKQS